jgi:D-cysteine desulfhydrase
MPFPVARFVLSGWKVRDRRRACDIKRHRRVDLPSNPFPLFARYPSAEKLVPRIALGEGPSPVARLERLAGRLQGGEIWIKNDGRYGRLYGGNKPRKLEFIFADARRRRRKTLITFGSVGTNHGLATALHGQEVGLRVVLLLTYEQPRPEIGEKLRRMGDSGAVMHYTRSIARTVVTFPYYLARYAEWRPIHFPYVVLPGASSPLGCLGYVNAALELAQQIKDGELPEPARIVVPLGTAGTAAGLLLGLTMAGLSSDLVAVAVTRAPTATASAVVRLANAAARLLRRRGIPLDVGEVGPSSLTVLRGWIGPGYGQPSRRGEEAKALLMEEEGLALDSTFTGKTMGALLELARRDELGGGPVLYWHTYNALALPPVGDLAEGSRLPRPFRRFLEPKES